MCHLKALNYPTHLMYMLNFMCNYENQYIFISTFLSINVDVIIIFITFFFIAFYSVYIFFKVYLLTMIGKCGKKSAKINLSKTWLLILPFKVFGVGYL